ncbi:hypothetical protein MSM1_15795 [Mycobacterium sp. SM1]|uniref:hypothetical protein n=1 Tax=Mycobacterium sp. SM1 TaxID=2816243 RepID=UPI001BCF157B|nr:hypothetical protein [Mycobacterium sp. SM1]MBS4729744.1 hypothetical protein [Mycobacterium sp. SM1]
MYVIRLLDGSEIQESKGDVFDLNPATGVVTVSRVDGFEETTTHYSPSAWQSVVHRVERSVVPASPWPMVGPQTFTL